MPKEPLSVPSLFKLVFFASLALTLISLGAAILLAIFGPQTEEVKKLIDVCSSMFVAGCGAVLGLLGGKGLK